MVDTDLAKTFSLGVLFKTESWEVHAASKHFGFGEDAHAADAIDFHLHVRVAVWIPQVCQMRSPSCVFCVTLYNDCVFVQSVRKSKSSLRLLPAVQIVGLLAAQPFGERTPDVCVYQLV